MNFIVYFIAVVIRSIQTFVIYKVCRAIYRTIDKYIFSPVFTFFSRCIDLLLVKFLPSISQESRKQFIDDLVFILCISFYLLVVAFNFFNENGAIYSLYVSGGLSGVVYYSMVFFLFVLPVFLIIKAWCF